MSFVAAIDISTFIWCEQDFNTNKNQYYNLLKVVPTIYEKIEELNLSVLLRVELYNSITGEFPHKMVNMISKEFGELTLSFLTKTNWFSYVENDDETIAPLPELKKKHYNENISIELQSQLCHIFYNNTKPENKFISYNYFFNCNDNLVLNNKIETIEVDTLNYNTEEDVIKFFNKHKLRFEHNPKHTRNVRYMAGEKISPFTCYYQSNGEEKAKRLFKEAIFCNGYFYNFDIENGVYVRFLKTHIDRPIYHAHDLSDENNNVPHEIKMKIKKNGRVF